MKKIWSLFSALVLLLVVMSCGQGEAVKIDGDYVILTPDEEDVASEMTLQDYMQLLAERGELTFVMESGMIMSINGVDCATGEYWMLYTDDTAYANTGWGECEYEGKNYGSAIIGAETLPITAGCTYIWYLQVF